MNLCELKKINFEFFKKLNEKNIEFCIPLTFN
jgi:hypothetical protein